MVPVTGVAALVPVVRGAGLKVKAGQDILDVGRAHLGLAAAGGDGFRFGELLHPAALFQGMKHHAEIRVGHDAGDGGERRGGIAQARW